jgi:hypothetical protein
MVKTGVELQELTIRGVHDFRCVAALKEGGLWPQISVSQCLPNAKMLFNLMSVARESGWFFIDSLSY